MEPYDLLNDFGGGEDINDTLVDSHLEAIPSVGTLTARGLTGGDAQDLGGHASGSLDLDALILSSTDEISAHYVFETVLCKGAKTNST